MESQDNLCHCYKEFYPGMAIPLENFNPPTCARCHKVLKNIEKLSNIPQTIVDLSLCSELEMLKELDRRYDCLVYIAKRKNPDPTKKELTMNWTKGNFNECAGMALEMAIKLTNAKLSTETPAGGQY